jgi:5-methyltetrahydrofolate--homocysteine methyltransferase
MNVIGDRFKMNEIYIPEVLIAARAMKEGMVLLRPLIASEAIKNEGAIVLGTVKGDLHDIGKNLVGVMLEGAGFDVIDLGIDVDPEKFIKATKENNASIIGLSCLLTTTMAAMEDAILSINNSQLNAKVKIMIGGAPITQKYADEIGADGYAPDAARAVDLARQLTS